MELTAGKWRKTLIACARIASGVSAVNSMFIGASNQLGEFESGATAALFGAVGSVVLGGVGTVLIAATWFRLFPALARRDKMESRSTI